MKKYDVEIEELLVLIVSTFAKSKDDAIKKIKDEYYNEEHILDSSNHFETQFRVFKKEETIK